MTALSCELREENQRLREAFAASNETNDNLRYELEYAERQSKIEVLKEVLVEADWYDGDRFAAVPVEAIDAAIEQLEGEE